MSLFKIGKIPGGLGRVTVLWMAAGCVEAGSSAALPAALRRAPESGSSSPRPGGSHFSNVHGSADGFFILFREHKSHHLRVFLACVWQLSCSWMVCEQDLLRPEDGPGHPLDCEWSTVFTAGVLGFKSQCLEINMAQPISITPLMYSSTSPVKWRIISDPFIF